MVQIYTDQNIPFVQSWEQRAVVLHLSANNAQTNGTNRLAGLISLILAYSKNVLDIVKLLFIGILYFKLSAFSASMHCKKSHKK
jgi:hypothetical protein